jgi:hypothetical protein
MPQVMVFITWLEQSVTSKKIGADYAPFNMAPQDGLEPPTKRLTVVYSTAELPWDRFVY